MERLINVHIEKLPEGYYLATSDAIPGLIAQGRTLAETLEIAQDVANQILCAMSERNALEPILRDHWAVTFPPVGDEFDFPLLLSK